MQADGDDRSFLKVDTSARHSATRQIGASAANPGRWTLGRLRPRGVLQSGPERAPQFAQGGWKIKEPIFPARLADDHSATVSFKPGLTVVARLAPLGRVAKPT